MLHPQYFIKGSAIDLPEISGYVDLSGHRFMVEEVYEGGMGMCIHLRQISSGNHYALKVILPEKLGSKTILDRFHDELQVWLSASMCNMVAEAFSVVRIDSVPCVLAAWMEGGDLASALPNLTAPRKFEALVRIIRGLRWVYEHLNVIHRDLKPSNILLDETEQAYIADWGLSRPVSQVLQKFTGSLKQEGIQRPDRTLTGNFLGTILYAAPEQIINAQGVDFQADIYALGCMMFEFETGQPPFLGRTVEEIIDQHLYSQPTKLGGFFKRTALGLENIIARCLKKNPEERFNSYAELEEELLKVAQKVNFSLERCQIAQRYNRSILGQGHKHQQQILATSAIKGSKDYAIIDYSEIEQFLEEAGNLINVGRVIDAELLLKPHYLPEMLNDISEWFPIHSLALNYAYCLEEIDGRLDEALTIFQKLNKVSKKPAEFYINYSLALLKASKELEAKQVCERGLRYYPNDIALIGNHTISLTYLGELDSARESALKRLKIRRDVHAIEEAVNVLQKLAEKNRDKDLPLAIRDAKTVGQLIAEGLELQPNFYSLKLAHICLFRFAQEEEKAAKLCNELIEKSQAHRTFKEMALFYWLEPSVRNKKYDAFFRFLEKNEGHIQTPKVINMFNELKNRVLAEHYMIGLENKNGERKVIKQVAEFFLKKEDKVYTHPLMASKVLEWIGRSDEAMETLNSFLKKEPTCWEGIKTMCLFLIRANQPEKAIVWADYFGTVAPWRAETFDWMSYTYEKVGKNNIAQQLKKKGDQVFESETKLLDELREFLDKLY